LIVKNILITIAFVPLTIFLNYVLKTCYNEIYLHIRCKFIILLSFYCIFNISRLLIYFGILYTTLRFTNTDPEIPLYTSEIIMILLLCYMLYKVSAVNSTSRETLVTSLRDTTLKSSHVNVTH
jgi:hypothetical protein